MQEPKNLQSVTLSVSVEEVLGEELVRTWNQHIEIEPVFEEASEESLEETPKDVDEAVPKPDKPDVGTQWHFGLSNDRLWFGGEIPVEIIKKMGRVLLMILVSALAWLLANAELLRKVFGI